jgi:AraC-like DNA-binding protein
MRSEFGVAAGPGDCAGVELLNVWHVQADRSYDVVAGARKPHIVAVRTLAGRGGLWLADGEMLEVGASSLMLLDGRELSRYRCLGKAWEFWWLGLWFRGAMPLPERLVVEVPTLPDESERLAEVMRRLRGTSTAERRLASALFVGILYGWLLGRQAASTTSPHGAAIKRVIDGMYQRLTDGWPVDEMATAACLGERRFRQVFQAETGFSPKAFHDRIRMNYATELLRLGTYSVGEVSGQLGFSSPFNFSRTFRRVMGLSPSKVGHRTPATGEAS